MRQVVPHLHMTDRAFLELVRGHSHPISYVADLPDFRLMPYGWILHVTEGNQNPFNLFDRNTPGSRKTSNLWVSKAGRIELYTPLAKQSWAQVAGNPRYWSVETQGFATEPLTPRQLNSLARIHAALEVLADRDFSHVIDKPGQVGVGTHSMGGAAWGGHACPGPIRAAQRQHIIDLAAKVRWQR